MTNRMLLKVSMALVLLALVVTAGLAAEIIPDGDPVSSGPGKITATGKYKLGDGETITSVEIVAVPSDEKGGVSGSSGAKREDVNKTYDGTVQDLTPAAEYKVMIILKYSKNAKALAVSSKTYTVKTKDTSE